MVKFLIIGLICLQSDWPKWGGSKSGFVVDSTIAKINTEKPLTLLWKQPDGEGYLGLIVSGNKVISQSRKGDAEFIFANDTEFGKEIWRRQYQCKYFYSLARYRTITESTAFARPED